MILKDGTKHACRSCITGHRSSKCIHHDRELFPIAKKGRPSTQCKDCKQRGTPSGRCECQAKRKPKAMKVDPSLANASGQGSSYPAEGSTSSGGATQFSGFHTPDDGSYSRMMGYPSGGMDGHSTRATNSSASSPSHLQHTFAINHAPLDSHAMPAGLPYPQGEAPFAYTIHNEPQGHGHGNADHLEQSHSRLSTGVPGSRPSTSGEEDVPWWLYRAGYSPNTGLPYEPPGGGGLEPVQEMPRAGYSDYGQYLPQPSPYMLGTPGAPAAQQPSPAFVWHNNATSYRDYMANQQQQQQVPNYHPAPHASHNSQVQQPQPAEQQAIHPGLPHHNSLPYSHASNLSEPQQASGHRSAPVSRSSDSDQPAMQYQRSPHDPSWASMSTESSNSGNYIASSHPHPHERRTSNNIPVTQQFANVPRSEEVPALIYEGGASQVASTESLISPISSSIPSHPGYATAVPPVDRRYESKAFRYHAKHDSPDTTLRERRSASFDQVASNRASPINLTLPEDRKKRKLEVDI